VRTGLLDELVVLVEGALVVVLLQELPLLLFLGLQRLRVELRDLRVGQASAPSPSQETKEYYKYKYKYIYVGGGTHRRLSISWSSFSHCSFSSWSRRILFNSRIFHFSNSAYACGNPTHPNQCTPP
jgi:hypothetical protein